MNDFTKDTGELKIMPGLYFCPVCLEPTAANDLRLEPLRKGFLKRRKICLWCYAKVKARYARPANVYKGQFVK